MNAQQVADFLVACEVPVDSFDRAVTLLMGSKKIEAIKELRCNSVGMGLKEAKYLTDDLQFGDATPVEVRRIAYEDRLGGAWGLLFLANLFDHLANEIALDWNESKAETLFAWGCCLKADDGFIHPLWKGRWTF